MTAPFMPDMVCNGVIDPPGAQLFLGRQLELNDFWTRFGDLVMGMHERRRDKRDALAWKFEISFGPRRRRAERESANPQKYPFREFHRFTPKKMTANFFCGARLRKRFNFPSY